MKNDVEGFQMGPHRMSRVRQAAVGEGVAGQKKTELVIDKRLRDRQPRQQCQAHCQSRNTAKQNTEGAFSGYLSQCLFRSLKPSCSQSRVHQRNQQRERNEQGFRPNAREHEQELSSRKL